LNHVLAYRRIHHPRFSDLDKHIIVILAEMLPVAFEDPRSYGAACIADEIAFWDSGGISPDREVLVALRPAMSTISSSKLLIISTPYGQSGTLYDDVGCFLRLRHKFVPVISNS
jgi:hypothetical protein